MSYQPFLTARQTSYKGILRRSRLEASGAAQFDRDEAEGKILSWDYEPLCFANETDQYLPDFRALHPLNGYIYVEVKPSDTPPEKWQKKMEVILDSEPQGLLILLC